MTRATDRVGVGRVLRLGAGAAVAAAVLVGCATVPDEAAQPTSAGPTPAASAPVTPPAATVPPGGVTVLDEGTAPAGLRIDAIGIDAPLIELGIDGAGAMEVPTDFDEIGWFTGGGMPGGRGPTVIAAHVDSPTGPAAFIDLDRLAVGDAIAVQDVDGVVHDYVVDEVADFAKDEFPTARVFGAVPDDRLRLVTCGGVFDPASGHYDRNVVVFAARA